jgi:hypothetical protein
VVKDQSFVDSHSGDSKAGVVKTCEKRNHDLIIVVGPWKFMNR